MREGQREPGIVRPCVVLRERAPLVSMRSMPSAEPSGG